MNKFSQFLKSNGQRQADFASRISASQASISKLCSGAMMPSREMAIQIEDVTNGAVSVRSWDEQLGILKQPKSDAA